MKHYLILAFVALMLFFSRSVYAQQQPDTVSYYDQHRARRVPVAIYKPGHKNAPVIIFSHGYGQNRSDSYLSYSYLTDELALKGYFVISIQHELPTDSLIPSSGNAQVVRRPFWERGAENIAFVITSLKRSYPELNCHNITLIGHSNGADMSALFPIRYPGVVNKIITLDNRRMILPRSRNVKVLSLRSSDQQADNGVLPTAAEAKEYPIHVVRLPHTNHDDMDDHATSTQRKEILGHIFRFLEVKTH